MLTLLLTSMLMLTFNIQPAETEPTTWTVDDDGPADFSSIQEAINAANQGDTIYVFNGTYYENVVVNKTVSLIGENSSTTIIDGRGAGRAFNIGSNNVSVTGFTTKNASIGFWLQKANFPQGDRILKDIVIVGNAIIDTSNGIVTSYCDSITITDNLILRGLYGISFLKTFASKVDNNAILNMSVFGTEFIDSGGNYIAENNLSAVGAFPTICILLDVESGSIIRKNRCVNSNFGGIVSDPGTNNTIEANTIENNDIGIRLYGGTSHGNNNTLRENTIRNNTYGIYLRSSRANEFYHNNLIDNIYQLDIDEELNSWDDGYPSGGNYWSDYEGVDEYGGTYQNETGNDGIGDRLYVINADNQDRYPLMNPWNLPIQPNFKVSASPASQTISQGASTTYSVNITSTGGFSSEVLLSGITDPSTSEISLIFDPASVTPASGGTVQSTLTVITTSITPPNMYNITINGASGTKTRSYNVTLIIEPMFEPDFSILASAISRALFQGKSTSFTITVTSLIGFSSPVSLGSTIEPSSSEITLTFDPEIVTPPIDGSIQSTLDVSTSPTVTTTDYTLTITGSGGGKSNSIPVELIIVEELDVDWEEYVEVAKLKRDFYKIYSDKIFSPEFFEGAEDDEVIDAHEWLIDIAVGLFLRLLPPPLSALAFFNDAYELVEFAVTFYMTLIRDSINLIYFYALAAPAPTLDSDLTDLIYTLEKEIEAVEERDYAQATLFLKEERQITERVYRSTSTFDYRTFIATYEVVKDPRIGYPGPPAQAYGYLRANIISLRKGLEANYAELTYLLEDQPADLTSVVDAPLSPLQSSPKVGEVFWEVDGEGVEETEVGKTVVAKVEIMAEEYNVVAADVTIMVKSDKGFWGLFDDVIESDTFEVELLPNENDILALEFTPEEASGLFLRGYYVVVEATWIRSFGLPEQQGQVYTMEDSYPPRLNVRGDSLQSGTIIVLEEEQDKLYVSVRDGNNRYVGFDYEGNQTNIEIPKAYFFDTQNGTMVIFLPPEVLSFEIVVDAKHARQQVETYNLTIITFANLQISNQTSITSTVEKDQMHHYRVEISPEGNIAILISSSFTWPLHWYVIATAVIVLTIVASYWIAKRSRKEKQRTELTKIEIQKSC